MMKVERCEDGTGGSWFGKVGVDGPAQAEVEPPALGRIAKEIIARQPLNPFRKLVLKPMESWRSDSMIELN